MVRRSVPSDLLDGPSVGVELRARPRTRRVSASSCSTTCEGTALSNASRAGPRRRARGGSGRRRCPRAPRPVRELPLPADALDQGINHLGRTRSWPGSLAASWASRSGAPHCGTRRRCARPRRPGSSGRRARRRPRSARGRSCGGRRAIGRHQARVEDAVRIGHVFLGIFAGLQQLLARLAELLPLGGRVAAGEVLGDDDRVERRADVGPLLQ